MNQVSKQRFKGDVDKRGPKTNKGAEGVSPWVYAHNLGRAYRTDWWGKSLHAFWEISMLGFLLDVYVIRKDRPEWQGRCVVLYVRE